MDVVKLIRGVKAREPLWDRKHGYYHDRTITMALWEDVAFSLGVDSETARTKWKGLRDTFRGELRKLHVGVVNGKPKTSTNWEYFDEMMFVKEQIYSNKRHLEELVNQSSTLPSGHPFGGSPDNSSSCEAPSKSIKIELTGSVSPSVPPAQSFTFPRGGENGRKRPEQVEARDEKQYFKKTSFEKMKNVQKATFIESDDDFIFLMSLLPQLRCLPTTRNLHVRLRIQELLYSEIFTSKNL